MTADKARALCRADVAAYAGDDPPLPALYACIDNAPALPDGQLPLVWTQYGHLPAAGLRYETAWHEEESHVAFRESYYLVDEVVKQSVHVMHRGASMAAEAGRIGETPSLVCQMTSIG